jgi:hypothetical protein
MTTIRRILCAAAALAAVAAFAHAAPASATEFQPEGTCAGTAIVHETKGIAADLLTWQFTVNGVTFPANALVDGYAVPGHPATVTVTGRYWRQANADTNTRADATSTSSKPVSYPTNCTPATTTTTPTPTTTPPSTTTPQHGTNTTVTATTGPPPTLPATGNDLRAIVGELMIALGGVLIGAGIVVLVRR